MEASMVYPRMGLKGLLTLGSQANMNMKAAATYLICSGILTVYTALAMKGGTKPKILAKPSRAEKSSKISTGRDMLMMLLPAMRLEVICFTISFSTPFCIFSYSSSMNTKSSPEVIFQRLPRPRKLSRLRRR